VGQDQLRRLAVLACALAAGCRPASAPAPGPARLSDVDLEPYAIRGLLARVADRRLAAHPAASGRGEPVDWREGAFAAGLAALADVSEDPGTAAALRAFGEGAAWRPARAQGAAAALAYLALYLRERDHRAIEPTVSLYDELVDNESDDPGLQSFAEPGSAPAAAVLGAPAVAALLTTATGDPKYLAVTERLWVRDLDRLYDSGRRLFVEARDGQTPSVRTSGWALVALARTLENLPEAHPLRARLETVFRQVAGTLAAGERADGTWPAADQGVDWAATALGAHALAWGRNHDLLGGDAETGARRAFHALDGAARAGGALEEAETAAAVLLAGAELFRLALFEGSRSTSVVVTNPLAEPRFEETAEIAWPSLAQELGAVPGDAIVAVDVRSGRLLPTQPFEADQRPRLLVSLSVLGDESRRVVVRRLARPFRPPRPLARAYGRFVPERRDDFAWENDRVAFRVYGQALERDQVSSGIDVWAKRVRVPVIDRWYQGAAYFQDRGEGLDFYHVGPSRGCGGLGLWDGHRLATSRNFHRWRLIAAGPVRVAFELGYDPWGPDDARVTETKLISLDLGQNLSRIESRFQVAGAARPLPVAVGIVRHGEGRLSRDFPTTWLSYVQPPQGPIGQIGCGVIAPAAASFVESEEHYLLVREHPSDRPFVYYAGAYWSKAPDFRDPDEWSVYLAAFSRRAEGPLTVDPAPSPQAAERQR
jgi:unsaturated rhamnogalacturonyl hydrolase